MLVYKLTDQNMQTRNGYQWTLGKRFATSGEGELCGPGWLHAYHDPLLAVLLNPIHADIAKPRLFRARTGRTIKNDRGLKLGSSSMTLLEELPVPEVTTEQRIRFAILCAKTVVTDAKWNAWADNWLNGSDRSDRSARAAEAAAAWATWAAAKNTKLDLIAIAHEACKK